MRRSRWRWWAPVMLLCVLLAGASAPGIARSQGPECPPGFVWKRMSGVGCVQEDCADIPNAHYSYTQSCICNDGYKACWEPVDYEGFDRTLCGPNCPNGRLVACVPADSPCPGEEPPPPTAAPAQAAETPAGAAGEPTEAAETQTTPEGAESDAAEEPTASGADLLQAAGRALAGGDVDAPTTGRAAAAGAAAGGALAATLIAELLMDLLSTNPRPATSTVAPGSAGTPPAAHTAGGTVDRIYDGDKAHKILDDLDILDGLRQLKRDDPQYWEKVDKALEKAKAHRRVKGITYRQGPGGLDESNIVIVVEEPEYGPYVPPAPPDVSRPATPPPVQPPAEPKPPQVKQEPPEIIKLRHKRVQELEDARKRVKELEALKKRLAEEYNRRLRNWEKARQSGFIRGAIDFADLLLSIRSLGAGPSRLPLTWYRGLGKSMFKVVQRNWDKYLADQYANWRTGKPLQAPEAKKFLWDPLGIKPLPGGGVKQVLRNLATKRFEEPGRGVGNTYSLFQRGYSVGKELRNNMALTRDLRKQMGHFYGRYLETERQLQTARDNLDTARKGVADVDRAIGQLKANSARFRNL